MHVRILQWNVWYKEQVQNIIAFLKEINADIICLQELTIGHELHSGADLPQKIADALGYHYYFVPAHTFPTGYKIGNGIFSRWPQAHGEFYYVQHVAPGPTGSEEARVYVQADVLVPDSALTVATTHLSYSLEHAYRYRRLKEINQLLEQLKTRTARFVFTGDLNATPESFAIERIRELLQHCGPPFDKPTWSTKPHTLGPVDDPGLHVRLDYVFATEDVKVVSSETPITGYSDHLPVLVEIEI